MRNSVKILVIALLCTMLCAVGVVSADSLALRGDLQRALSLQGSADESAAGNGSALHKEITPITVSGHINGAGRYQAKLSLQRKASAHRSIVLLQGEGSFLGATRAGDTAVAAAFTPRGDTHELRLFLPSGKKMRRKTTRVYELTANVAADGAVSNLHLRRSRQRLADAMHCGSDMHSATVPTSGDVHASVLKTFKVIDLQVEGDVEFFSKFADPVAELNTVINLADAFYRRDVSMTFSTTVVPTAQPYSSTIQFDSNYELDTHKELRNKYPNRSADLIYVFTGKVPSDPTLQNLAGMVPGLGNVCSQPSDALGMVIRYATTADDAITFAHEAGHNFNAEHDDSLTGNIGYIMNSGTNSPTSYVDQFSSYSISAINSYVAQNSSCLSETTEEAPENGTPPSSNLTLYVYKERDGAVQFLVGEAYDGETAASGQTLQLVYKKNKKQTSVKVIDSQVTDESGYVAFEFRKTGLYAIRTTDGASISRFINYKKSRR